MENDGLHINVGVGEFPPIVFYQNMARTNCADLAMSVTIANESLKSLRFQRHLQSLDCLWQMEGMHALLQFTSCLTQKTQGPIGDPSEAWYTSASFHGAAAWGQIVLFGDVLRVKCETGDTEDKHGQATCYCRPASAIVIAEYDELNDSKPLDDWQLPLTRSRDTSP